MAYSLEEGQPALTPPECTIQIINENLDRIRWDNHCDLASITANTSKATTAYERANRFGKRRNTVIIGGIRAAVLRNEAKEHADSVVMGEAGNSWLLLLEAFKHNKLKLFYNQKRVIGLCLSMIPRYHLLKRENYKAICVQTTRTVPP